MYLDPLLKRSKSLPSVGKYNIIVNKKIKKNPMKMGDNIEGFRPTVFDSLDPDNTGIAPGNYEVHKVLFKIYQRKICLRVLNTAYHLSTKGNYLYRKFQVQENIIQFRLHFRLLKRNQDNFSNHKMASRYLF